MLIMTECLQMLLRLKHKNKPDKVISSSLHSFSLLRKTHFYHIRNFSLKYLLVVKALFFYEGINVCFTFKVLDAWYVWDVRV